MTLRAILLDIDGTLLDSNDAHARAWQEVLARHGYDVPYETLRPLIGKGGDKLLQEVAGIDDRSEIGNLLTEERQSLFTEKYLPSLAPTHGARDLLQSLKSRGFELVVATSAGNDDLLTLLRQAGVDDLVKSAATSNDAARSKPDPDIVQAALDKAGLQPHEAIMLGDTPHDMRAAQAAGVRAVILRCGGWWRDDAFAGAAAIYDDPWDLLVQLADSPFLQDMVPSRGDTADRYTQVRMELTRLHSQPVRDMPAIDAALAELDEIQAALKAQHRGVDDHQRY